MWLLSRAARKASRGPGHEWRTFICRWTGASGSHACRRVHDDDCGGEIGGDREGCGVDDFDGAAGDAVCGLLGEVVGVALGEGDEAGKGDYVLFGDV